jgi:hypothetical protein
MKRHCSIRKQILEYCLADPNMRQKVKKKVILNDNKMYERCLSAEFVDFTIAFEFNKANRNVHFTSSRAHNRNRYK